VSIISQVNAQRVERDKGRVAYEPVFLFASARPALDQRAFPDAWWLHEGRLTKIRPVIFLHVRARGRDKRHRGVGACLQGDDHPPRGFAGKGSSSGQADGPSILGTNTDAVVLVRLRALRAKTWARDLPRHGPIASGGHRPKSDGAAAKTATKPDDRRHPQGAPDAASGGACRAGANFSWEGRGSGHIWEELGPAAALAPQPPWQPGLWRLATGYGMGHLNASPRTEATGRRAASNTHSPAAAAASPPEDAGGLGARWKESRGVRPRKRVNPTVCMAVWRWVTAGHRSRGLAPRIALFINTQVGQSPGILSGANPP